MWFRRGPGFDLPREGEVEALAEARLAERCYLPAAALRIIRSMNRQASSNAVSADGQSDAYVEIVKDDTVDNERRAIAAAHTGVPQIAPHFESLNDES
jgi:predicted Zn-dependent protease